MDSTKRTDLHPASNMNWRSPSIEPHAKPSQKRSTPDSDFSELKLEIREPQLRRLPFKDADSDIKKPNDHLMRILELKPKQSTPKSLDHISSMPSPMRPNITSPLDSPSKPKFLDRFSRVKQIPEESHLVKEE
eukprot:TRINITY_DN6585_c0_g1_i4.p1 TRINITY_DN6585_c0_g1~~TRINITY_DN6585_c0_g1_i4.p1  ORF type:complete len:133 (-),score=37.53 TRINITY_DN6585_c0_g1_i4:20-418(-)